MIGTKNSAPHHNTESGWRDKLSGTYLPYVQLGIILLLGIVSYANSLDVPLQVDDSSTIRVSIAINSELFGIPGFIRMSRWFADLTFALNRHLHGERVLGYHLFNSAIHLASAGVIYCFVRQTITALQQTFRAGEVDQGQAFAQRFIPFAVAALFVCHPIQTQAVTYIAQRYTSLATFLYVSSLLSYLLARIALADKKKLPLWLGGSACFLTALLAMKCKEIAFTLPLMIAALEVALFRGKLLKNRIFIVLGVILLLVIPLQLLYMRGAGNPADLLNRMQAASAETQAISRSDYLLTQFRVVATYLRLLILPIDQNWDYDYPIYHTLWNTQVLGALWLHFALAGLAVALFLRSKRHFAAGALTPGISTRLASFGIFWFYLALSVESSVVPIRDVIFEHRIYLPSVGFFLAVAAALAGIAAHRQSYRIALWVMLAPLCLALTAGTIARNRIWSDELTLWQDALKKSPRKSRASMAVGVLYFRRFMPERALPHFVRALELDSSADINWINLTSVIALIGEYKERCSDGTAYHLTVDTVNPLYRKAWQANNYNNMGLAYEYSGNQNMAREYYLKAVTTNPSLDLAWFNMALLAARQHDTVTVAESLTQLGAIGPLLEKKARNLIGEPQPPALLNGTQPP
jgi:tetratricopeptide (TPR) repeat protein